RRTATPTSFRASNSRSKVGGRFDSPARDRPKEPNPSPVLHPGGEGPILTNRRRLCKPAIGPSERSGPSLPFSVAPSQREFGRHFPASRDETFCEVRKS